MLKRGQYALQLFVEFGANTRHFLAIRVKHKELGVPVVLQLNTGNLDAVLPVDTFDHDCAAEPVNATHRIFGTGQRNDLLKATYQIAGLWVAQGEGIIS